MSILDKASPRYRLDAKNPPSSSDEIESLRAVSPIDLPEEFLGIIREGSDIEISVDGGEYIRIWGAGGCLEMNEAYNVFERIPHSLAIGDNEGGSALIYIRKVEKPGLYIVGFGSMAMEDAEYVAPCLTDLLVREVGIDLFS